MPRIPSSYTALYSVHCLGLMVHCGEGSRYPPAAFPAARRAGTALCLPPLTVRLHRSSACARLDDGVRSVR